MYYYQIYGQKIASDYLISQIDQTSNTQAPDIIVREDPHIPILDTDIHQSLTSNGDFLYSCKGQWAAVRAAGNAVFEIENGMLIRYHLLPGFDPETIKQLLVHTCIIIARTQRGQVALHGSCIEMNNQAVIISGASGAGKSTLATELIKSGARFLSDDICAIVREDRSYYVEAGIAERKLCEDALDRYGFDRSRARKLHNIEKNKYVISDMSHFCKEARLLRAIIIIEPCECGQVQIEEVNGSDKIKYITDCVLHRDIHCMVGNEREMMQQCIQLAIATKIYVIKRPLIGDSSLEMVRRVTGAVWERV